MISGWVAAILAATCLGLVWHGVPFGKFAQGVITEFGCLSSVSRFECLRQRHQETETQALNAIEAEMQELKRHGSCVLATKTDDSSNCTGQPETPINDR